MMLASAVLGKCLVGVRSPGGCCPLKSDFWKLSDASGMNDDHNVRVPERRQRPCPNIVVATCSRGGPSVCQDAQISMATHAGRQSSFLYWAQKGCDLSRENKKGCIRLRLYGR